MYKGVYLVTEKACMNPATGAFRHITIGMEELSAHFKIDLIAPEVGGLTLNSKVNKTEGSIKRPGKLKGLFTDLKTLLINHKNIFNLYKKIKLRNPVFIYERVSYLNYNGLIIAKLLKVRHFYELNGVPHQEIKKYYPSFFNGVVRKMEEIVFERSDYIFIVGSWNKSMHLRRKNWISIENGIEEGFHNHFTNLSKSFSKDSSINIVFIGFLISKNHKPELLLSSLQKVSSKKSLKLHLIGARMDELASTCNNLGVETICHGNLNRQELMRVLEDMHVGLIPGGKDYQSFMKIFEYGASKCLVVAPDLYNLKHWFTEKDIYFFKKDDSNDLSNIIDKIIENPSLIEIFGNHFHETIKDKFTWGKIFTEVKRKIKMTINDSSPRP